MRVGFLPSDSGGCGKYRLSWPGGALAAAGYDVKQVGSPQLLTDQKGRMVGLAQPLRADTIVFQRPARPQYVEAFKYLKSIGIRVVVDMDDDLSCIHPKNSAFVPYQQMGVMHWAHAIEACRIADTVVCATDALAAKYGDGGNTIVVPNHIPERYLSITKPTQPRIIVGWAGFVSTHPVDLQITKGAINEALARTRDKSLFYAIGDDKAFTNLSIRKRPPHSLIPGAKIDRYANLIAKLDIGIVPLEDSEFNRAKSWLKALEYASVGAVPVVSPTPDNMRMVEAGAAVAASGPREWKEEVQRLIEDDDARTALQKRAREFAAEWTIEGNIEKWARAWGA